MLQMQGPGLSLPSLVSCYDDQSCMTTSTPSRSQYCSPNPQNNYHSGRVLQEMMYQNEVNFPGFMADHRGNQGLQSSWSTPWGPRQNVPYLAHPHPADPYQYAAYGGEMGDYQDDVGGYPQKRKRARTAFSADQLKKLEKRFLANHYIVGEERQKVAKDLELSEAQVKVWFQNRRTKFKRDQELERLGKKKKRKGEHHIRKWQITTKHFYPELDNEDRINSQL